jgi:ubiquinone/menaquinone biosynthesis C-methylase UbiE
MNAHTSTYAHDLSYVLDYYDWTSLGHARVVDIGGAKGHVALALASRFPNLTLTVQDMEAVVKGTEEAVPADLKERVHFMAHSLFTTQTIEADVYYLRWILHNWSDKYCARILKAQVPVLKPGARILIQESCMPEPGETALWIERDLRYVTDKTRMHHVGILT